MRRPVAVVAAAPLAACAAIAGVETGPVTLETPSKPPATLVATDKVDVLLAIDNSAGMADKQEIFARSVTRLVSRLVAPSCLDDVGRRVGEVDGQGRCATGSREFAPVRDMHIGIVSTSLGGAGSDTCTPDLSNPVNPALNRHNDDQGRLIHRGGPNEEPVAGAGSSGFLAYLAGDAEPDAAVPIRDPSKLLADLQLMIEGVHDFGCGYEAQLESWYRFLVQPDPYERLARDGNEVSLVGVDATLLAQRAAFLRPDSAVVIMLLTDENDSIADPMAIGGQGWVFENSAFPSSPNGAPPRATEICATKPADPGCTSCAFAPQDRECATKGQYYEPHEESRDTRFFHMKRRFGVDVQFPIRRYAAGLTALTVPSREGEHPGRSSEYVGTAECRNPLFAAALPASVDEELCALPPGPRTPEFVFFQVIGGVPSTVAPPGRPTAEDWKRMLGADPLGYDFDGADLHMLESIEPRAGLPGTTARNDADVVHGREWTTRGSGLQYACTFPLMAPKDCTNPIFKPTCDCFGNDSPVCDAANKNIQVRGDAFPSIRELAVARAVAQSFPDNVSVASICPRSIDPQSADFGYRPAMDQIVDRLKRVLVK